VKGVLSQGSVRLYHLMESEDGTDTANTDTSGYNITIMSTAIQSPLHRSNSS